MYLYYLYVYDGIVQMGTKTEYSNTAAYGNIHKEELKV